MSAEDEASHEEDTTEMPVDDWMIRFVAAPDNVQLQVQGPADYMTTWVTNFVESWLDGTKFRLLTPLDVKLDSLTRGRNLWGVIVISYRHGGHAKFVDIAHEIKDVLHFENKLAPIATTQTFVLEARFPDLEMKRVPIKGKGPFDKGAGLQTMGRVT